MERACTVVRKQETRIAGRSFFKFAAFLDGDKAVCNEVIISILHMYKSSSPNIVAVIYKGKSRHSSCPFCV